VEPDLDELQLDRFVLLEWSIGAERVELAVVEHLEVVEMDVAVPGRDEEEPAAGRLLDRGEAAAARACEEREHARVNGDLERLHPRSLRDHPELSLDLEGHRRLGDHEPVAATLGTLVSEDLAGAVGHVLPRHLHEPQW